MWLKHAHARSQGWIPRNLWAPGDARISPLHIFGVFKKQNRQEGGQNNNRLINFPKL